MAGSMLGHWWSNAIIVYTPWGICVCVCVHVWLCYQMSAKQVVFLPDQTACMHAHKHPCTYTNTNMCAASALQALHTQHQLYMVVYPVYSVLSPLPLQVHLARCIGECYRKEEMQGQWNTCRWPSRLSKVRWHLLPLPVHLVYNTISVCTTTCTVLFFLFNWLGVWYPDIIITKFGTPVSLNESLTWLGASGFPLLMCHLAQALPVTLSGVCVLCVSAYTIRCVCTSLPAWRGLAVTWAAISVCLWCGCQCPPRHW